MSTGSHAVDGQLAEARRIGEDVEVLVAREIDGLELVPDAAAEWYDAITTGLLALDLLDGSLPVRFGTPVVEAGTPVEIKGALAETANGGRSTPGRWYFRGRNDGQHARLLDASAVYALAVYREVDPTRELCAVAVVPASVVDEHLRGRWYDSGCEDGHVAKLGWPNLLDLNLTDGGGA